ncbi:hypothetical protein Tco_1415092 [Tanacetum coccineum]
MPRVYNLLPILIRCGITTRKSRTGDGVFPGDICRPGKEKILENSVEVLKIRESKLESMKILENKLEPLKLQENQPVDGLIR